MTVVAGVGAIEREDDTRETADWRSDLKMILSRITLGLAAGGLSGMLVGGIGGRIAMLILRVTSSDSVRGIETDDEFIIGRFTASGSFSLVMACAFMGSLTGLFVIAGRPFLPRRHVALAWGVAGAITGGSLFIHYDGVDFRVLSPLWLAVVMFMVLPAAGAWLIAWLVEWMAPFWWKDRRRTLAAMVGAVPGLIIFVGPVGLVAGAAWFIAMRIPRARDFPGWQPARIAAMVVFAAVVVIGGVALTDSVTRIL